MSTCSDMLRPPPPAPRLNHYVDSNEQATISQKIF